MRKVILKNTQSPGDIVMMTAAVRDLHKAHPGEFVTGVRTSCPALWQHNVNVTAINPADADAELIECHYPMVHKSNQLPRHFVEAFGDYLGPKLGLPPIRATEFNGDVHVSKQEKLWFSAMREMTGEDIPFWIIVAGGKQDCTAKWWIHERYQEVVDYFAGRICFIQVGEMSKGHVHPPLRGVIDMRGETDLRQFVRLMYHAQGVVCGITFAMHLAAAVETARGMPKLRPCVVVGGGREPAHFVAYPGHQFIHTNGALKCCEGGGCWKSRTVALGDGYHGDGNLCADVIEGQQRCMRMITAGDVCRRIESYFDGGVIPFLNGEQFDTLHAKGVFLPSTRGRYDRSKWPLLARGMARRAQLGDRGVGDVLARMISNVLGIAIGPEADVLFKQWYTRIRGRDCGCADRQAKLNAEYPIKEPKI